MMRTRSARTRWLWAGTVVLCIAAGTATAEDWQVVHTSENRTDWLDRSSLKLRQGLWSAWTRTRFAQPQHRAQDGLVFKSARTLMYFDCDMQRMGAATIDFFADAGWVSNIGTLSVPDLKKLHMDAASPGSQESKLLEAGCTRP